jgi:hypothetical protein
MEELLRAYGRESECVGEHDREREKGERRDQEVLLIYSSKMRRLDPAPSQEQDSGQHDPE